MRSSDRPDFEYSTDSQVISYYPNGLTKREYFAAMAMQGFASNHDAVYLKAYDMLIEKSIKMADELLKQLEK